ncbi:MAG: hypothetical protein Q7U99_18400 [Rubrivivax sp.]|nr:hypothetical protein [Rubrivivax sp.]
MAFTSILQIIKLNEPRKGTSKRTGNPYEMQDAECIILNEDGTPAQVGVLMIPKELMGKIGVGTFVGSFALRADTRQDGGRKINAELVGLQSVPVKAAK